MLMAHVRLVGSFLTLLICLGLGPGFSGNDGNRPPAYVSCSPGRSSEEKPPQDQEAGRQIQTAFNQQQDKSESEPVSPYELRRSEHEIIDGGSTRWLAITTLGGRGSGYRLYVESLYAIADNGLEEVMDFPSYGFLGGVADHACPAKEFVGRITSVRNDGESTVVNVKLDVTYSGADEKEQLWSKKQYAVFRRAAGSLKFTLDEANSDLSEQELEDVYYDDMWLSKEKMVKYYAKELTKIALGSNGKSKEWLSKFLPDFTVPK